MKRALIILAALFVASMAVNVWLMERQPKVETTIETRTDTFWRDTVIEKPVAAETIQTGRVVYVKVAVPQPQTQRDTVHDSIEVPVPIVQKRYDDSLYTAWVSGFEPALDSIRLHLPEVNTLTTVTKTITKPAKRFSIGPSVGVGFGLVNQKADVFVGVTATWNIW